MPKLEWPLNTVLLVWYHRIPLRNHNSKFKSNCLLIGTLRNFVGEALFGVIAVGQRLAIVAPA